MRRSHSPPLCVFRLLFVISMFVLAGQSWAPSCSSCLSALAGPGQPVGQPVHSHLQPCQLAVSHFQPVVLSLVQVFLFSAKSECSHQNLKNFKNKTIKNWLLSSGGWSGHRKAAVTQARPAAGQSVVFLGPGRPGNNLEINSALPAWWFHQQL